MLQYLPLNTGSSCDLRLDKIFSRQHIDIFFLFSQENGDNLYELSYSVFLKKI